jgi:hypothetical protein
VHRPVGLALLEEADDRVEDQHGRDDRRVGVLVDQDRDDERDQQDVDQRALELVQQDVEVAARFLGGQLVRAVLVETAGRLVGGEAGLEVDVEVVGDLARPAARATAAGPSASAGCGRCRWGHRRAWEGGSGAADPDGPARLVRSRLGGAGPAGPPGQVPGWRGEAPGRSVPRPPAGAAGARGGPRSVRPWSREVSCDGPKRLRFAPARTLTERPPRGAGTSDEPGQRERREAVAGLQRRPRTPPSR